jgi:hypothetical protein
MPHALRNAIGRAGDHETPVAVADQDDLGQVLVPQQVHQVGDVRVEVGLRRGQVDALGEAGVAQRVDVVAVRPQRVRDGLPGPRAQPETGNQYVCRHGNDASLNTGQDPPGFGGNLE